MNEHFTKLPDEMQQEIASYLNKRDIRSLRASSSSVHVDRPKLSLSKILTDLLRYRPKYNDYINNISPEIYNMHGQYTKSIRDFFDNPFLSSQVHINIIKSETQEIVYETDVDDIDSIGTLIYYIPRHIAIKGELYLIDYLKIKKENNYTTIDVFYTSNEHMID